MKRTIVITGGAGFIGSHVVRLFVNKYPEYHIINLDKLTYAGNLANLKDIEDKPNYEFVKMDICDFDAFYKLMQDKKVDGIIHLAAESHVDRSIKDPFTFAQTNVMGTLSLLQAAKLYWESQPTPYEVSQETMANGKCSMVNVPCRFYHISTDEVYGALELTHPEGIEPPFTTTASSSEHHIIVLDRLTYAGNLADLKDIEDKPNYEFVKMDICDFDAFYKLMQDKKVDGIIHLAAESHVDRSIKDPFTFAKTNVMGTLSLLQAAKLYWESLPEKYEGKRFYHISTDEVYGALELTHPEGIEPPFTTTASSSEHHLAYGDKFFLETTKYNPHSPYSAAKASSDHFVRAYHDTYGMPVVVTNCSNNYGP